MRREILSRLARTACAGLLAGPALAAWATEPATAQAAWQALARDGAIVLLRHAHAPGVGDPPGMRIGDCATQRNLDESGRAQARRIGQAFRERGVRIGAVLTSQWCRTRETAQEAFGALAPAGLRDQPAFNSWFGGLGDPPRQTAQAREILRRWQGPGVLVVVTHQVNITALTGQVPASGEAVVVRPAPGDQPWPVVGRLTTP